MGSRTRDIQWQFYVCPGSKQVNVRTTEHFTGGVEHLRKKRPCHGKGMVWATLLIRQDVLLPEDVGMEWNGMEWNGMEYGIRAKGPALGPVRSLSADRRREMLFSFKNKYHYTYPNTYIALYYSHAKVTCNTHTNTKNKKLLTIPLRLLPR